MKIVFSIIIVLIFLLFPIRKAESPALPTPIKTEQKKAPIVHIHPKVKGIYVTAPRTQGHYFQEILELVDQTALNAMVIDIKDDYGAVTFAHEAPYVSATPYICSLPKLMNQLKEHNIYPIARIVVFKDTLLATKKPEWSFTKKDSKVWKNKRKESFVNPYIKEVWDYNIEIAKQAALNGFKEIQFDYVRFPEGFEKKEKDLKFIKNEQKRTDLIAAFVKYAKEKLSPYNVKISVDIFGYAASVPAAEGIGQDFVKISEAVDVICPMVYPSHYSTGWYKVQYPDTMPYEVIQGSMQDTLLKLKDLPNAPIIRPWIQSFTARWLGKGKYIPYEKEAIELQLKALKDTGIEEYLLWNASSRYIKEVEYDFNCEKSEDNPSETMALSTSSKTPR